MTIFFMEIRHGISVERETQFLRQGSSELSLRGAGAVVASGTCTSGGKHGQTSMRGRLEGLHGLRGLAALLVVLFHAQAIPRIELAPPFGTLIGHFFLSVLFFFVLSAFALTHSSEVSPTSLANYAVRRFFRIAPLFYAVMAWNLWRSGFPGWDVLLANLTFVFNFRPGLEQSLVWAGWSVGVEMAFYLILPLLLWACVGWKSSAIVWVAALVASVIIWSDFRSNPALPRDYAYFFVGSNLPSFVGGIVACRIMSRLPATRGGGGVGTIATVLMVVAFADPLYLQWRSPGIYFALWAAAFAAICLWQSLWPAAPLRSALMQWLGDRSFSIYLLHPIILVLGEPAYGNLAARLGAGGGASYLVCLVVSLPMLFLCAELSYRLVETPGIALGRWIAKRLASSRARRSIRSP
ncbi:MAG: acyltransferase family protein [Gammaproteobacteria bacterium]